MRNSEIPRNPEPGLCHEEELLGTDFVEIVDGNDFDVKMQYPLLHMEHAQEHCYMRREVYERLVRAQESLPGGIRLRILDAWRPFKLQEELYYRYSEDIIREFHLEHADQEERDRVIGQFVCLPSREHFREPVHTTGGAVDVTLCDESGRELRMGTGFDEMTNAAWTAYFESEAEADKEIRDNRRLLYHTMIRAGFTNLPSEWWHYDYGDRFWAYYKRQPVLYEAVYEAEGIIIGQF